MNQKVPWILVPAGPGGWASYDQIVPVLLETWRHQGFHIENVWFPRPRLTREWLNTLRRSASHLVFPLGIGHYDALWTLARIRDQGIDLPAVIMVASDLTKGFQALFSHQDVLRKSDLLITNCEAEANLARLAFGKDQPVRAIPLPVQTKDYKPASNAFRRNFKTSIGMSAKDPLIFYAGRISLQKNIHGLLEVFQKFHKKNPSAKLILAGPADDIGIPHLKTTAPKLRYIHSLSLLVTHYKLEDSVRFLGRLEQTEMKKYLAACDAQISMTLHSGEDFGYAIAQGLSCGAPTAITCWGGGNDFAQSAAKGIPVNVTSEGPEIQLARACQVLSEVVENSSDWRKKARRYALDSLTPAKVGKLWREALQMATSEAKTGSQNIRIHENFLSSYQESIQRRKKGPAPFTFESPKDPLYQRICRIYAGLQGYR